MPKRKASAPAGKAPPAKKGKQEKKEDPFYTESELKKVFFLILFFRLFLCLTVVQFTVINLRVICQENGLSFNGLKADLVQRILDNQKMEPSEDEDEDEDDSTFASPEEDREEGDEDEEDEVC